MVQGKIRTSGIEAVFKQGARPPAVEVIVIVVCVINAPLHVGKSKAFFGSDVISAIMEQIMYLTNYAVQEFLFICALFCCTEFCSMTENGFTASIKIWECFSQFFDLIITILIEIMQFQIDNCISADDSVRAFRKNPFIQFDQFLIHGGCFGGIVESTDNRSDGKCIAGGIHQRKIVRILPADGAAFFNEGKDSIMF